MNESLSPSYGAATALNCAGCFESVVLDSVAVGTLYLRQHVIHPYNWNGKVQAVTIPRYTAVTVIDTLKPKAWDGTTGGILVLDAAGGSLTLNAPISADGAGFRGGRSFIAGSNGCNPVFPQIGLYYPSGNWRGAQKGEGVASFIAGKELGRGAQTNGGGGGNDHNSGGGGGGHFSGGGGGGRNDEPNPLGCDGDYPGLGGLGINSVPQRAFLGGGGGAGHTNNILNSNGGNGGGIVYLRAGFLFGSQQIITANGTSGRLAEGDGGGGGGAGGTLWISIPNPPVNIQLSAKGGDGSNTNASNANRCYGPGGGGAGGRIVTNLWSGLSPTTVAGGQAGKITNSSNACNGESKGAEPGNAGEVVGLVVLPPEKGRLYAPRFTTAPLPDTVCAEKSATFTANANPGNWAFQWQADNGSGFQNLNNGNGLSGTQTPTLQLDNIPATPNQLNLRCLVQKNSCPPIASEAAQLTVLPLPTADFTFVAQGGMVQFDALLGQAQGQEWDFGDGNTSQLPNPLHSYASNGDYIVTLRAWNACDTVTAQKTITALPFPPPTADFFVADTIKGCSKANVVFQNRSSADATTFEWQFPGGAPAGSNAKTPLVTYNAAGTYKAILIASNAAGADTVEHTFVVRLSPSPIADFSFSTVSGRTVQFNGTAQHATTYTWLFGDNSTPATTLTTSHTYGQSGKYVVSLTAANGCGAATLQKRVLVN